MRRWEKRIADQFLDDVDGIKWVGALETAGRRGRSSCTSEQGKEPMMSPFTSEP